MLSYEKLTELLERVQAKAEQPVFWERHDKDGVEVSDQYDDVCEAFDGGESDGEIKFARELLALFKNEA